MSGLRVVIAREYIERVRQKSFWLTTIFGLLVILGLAFLPALIDKLKSDSALNIVVLEETGQVTNYLDTHLTTTLPDGNREFSFQAEISDSGTWADKKDSLVAAVNSGQISAFMEIYPPDAPDQIIWHSKQSLGQGTQGEITLALQQMQVEQRAMSLNLSGAELASLFAPINFSAQIEGLKGESVEEQTQNMALVYFLLFILYFSLMVYGLYVATGVAEEKSNRVMEMMLVSVKPTTLMTGKILGIGAAGLTQYIVWIASGLAAWTIQAQGQSLIPGLSFSLSAIDPAYLIYFGVFFILGFLLYAALYAGLGSTVSRIEDVNQAVGIITIFIVIAFMLAMMALETPDSSWVVILSYIPFFTPMLLFERIVLTNMSNLSIALGILDLILATVLAIWLAGKTYRVGVLMYGKVSWRAIFRALRSERNSI